MLFFTTKWHRLPWTEEPGRLSSRVGHNLVTDQSCLQSFPASGPFLMSHLFVSGGESIGASTSVLPMNIQDWFPLGLLVCSPYSPTDSQEFSPTPQFKTINSSAFSCLYGPTLTSIHDYGKNHSFDYTDLCWQSNVSAFNVLSRFVKHVENHKT